MCVAMVIIHTKTLEKKKAVDDVTSAESLQQHEPPAMSHALFSCGIMESARWPEVCGSSLESLWDGVRETGTTGGTGGTGGISGLLHDLSLSEASPSPAPPSKRQCRSLSCSSDLGWRSAWRPQGVWASVGKRRCHSGGSVQRTALAHAGFPLVQRSSSFSFSAPQTQISPTAPASPASPASTPELERHCPHTLHTHTHTLHTHTHTLPRCHSQPCVHQKTSLKRRRPEDTHRPSLDLLKMTQKLQDFHSVSCPGFPGDGQRLLDDSDVTSERPRDDPGIHQSERSWAGPKERECLWAGLCSRRGRDLFQLGGELDIEQIERN